MWIFPITEEKSKFVMLLLWSMRDYKQSNKYLNGNYNVLLWSKLYIKQDVCKKA